MLKTPLTKERLKYHFQYSLWKYVLAACLIIMGLNLVFTMTAYRAPDELKVDLYMSASGANQEALQAYLNEAHAAVLPDMEEVNVFVMMTNDGSDQYAVMQLSTYIMAGEGDIYLLSREDFLSYAAQGVMIDLAPYIESGALSTVGIDLKKGYAEVREDEDMPVELRLCGIPAEDMFGLWDYNVDNRGMVFGVMATGKNQENAIKLMDYMVKTWVKPMPTAQ